eukprot:m.71207 g.71207  ORF g.71207 m.71207 type:complete len:727 (+) comp14197_c0_seq1:108-2288(+)
MSVEPLDLSSDEEDRDELMLELAQALNELPEHLLLGDSNGHNDEHSGPNLEESFRGQQVTLAARQPSQNNHSDYTAVSTINPDHDSDLASHDDQYMPTMPNGASRAGDVPWSTATSALSELRDDDTKLASATAAALPFNSHENAPSSAAASTNPSQLDHSRKLAAIITSSSLPTTPQNTHSMAEEDAHLTPPQLQILYRAECRKTGQLQALLEEQRQAYQAQHAELAGQLASMQAGSQELVEEITAMTTELRSCQLQLQDKDSELETARSELRGSQHARGLAEAGEAAVRDELQRLEEAMRTQTTSQLNGGQSAQLQQQLLTMRQQHEAMVSSLRQQLAQQQQQAQAQQQDAQQQVVRLQRQLQMTPASAGRSFAAPAPNQSADWSSIDELLALSVHSQGSERKTAVDNTSDDKTNDSTQLWRQRCQLLESRVQHLESQQGTQVPETDLDILREELGKALEQADAWSRTCLDLQRHQRTPTDTSALGPEIGLLAEELKACEAEKTELQQQLATVTRASNSQEIAQYREHVARLSQQLEQLIDDKARLQGQLESLERTHETEIAQARQRAQDESTSACRQVVNALKERLVNVKNELERTKRSHPQDLAALQSQLQGQATLIAQQQRDLLKQEEQQDQTMHHTQLSAEAVKELHQRYEQTLQAMQADMRTHLDASRQRTTEYIERSVVHERYLTALRLNSYYITAMARLLMQQQQGEDARTSTPMPTT